MRGARKIQEREEGRLLILTCQWPIGKGQIDLEVTFSDLHPFFRPTVKSRSLSLHRHQNVFSSDICLLTEDTGEWRADQYVADLIAEQLPQALTASAAHAEGRAEDAQGIEEDTPDPLYRHFRFLSTSLSSLIFSATWPVPSIVCGFGTAAIRRPRTTSDTKSFDGSLVEITDPFGARLADRLQGNLVGGPTNIGVIWLKRRPEITKDPDASYKVAIAAVRQSLALTPGALSTLEAIQKSDQHLLIYLYGDEIEYGQTGQGLGTVCLSVELDAKFRRRAEYIPTYPVSKKILTERTTFGNSLSCKKCTIIGCGAIGNFVASSLARNGLGILRVADEDVLEPGNSVRWSLGRPYWGLPKALALSLHLQQNYPFTKMEALSGSLGKAFSGAMTLESLFEGELLVDTTATFESISALSYFSKINKTNFLAGYATEGLYGGIVYRQEDTSNYCFNCLLLHWADENEQYPLPPSNPDDRLRPIGCSAATFMGASFDAEEVSLQVSRSAIGFLTGAVEYVDDWDGAVLSLRNGKSRCLPRWQGFQISAHPACCGV